MAEIGLGFYAGIPGWASTYANARWQLVSDPGDMDPFPGRQTIGRVPTKGDAWEWELVKRGKDGAREFADYCRPWWAKGRWCACWLGPNEPPAGSLEEAELLSRWYEFFVPIAHEAGVKIAGGCFSMGRPDEHILEAYLPLLRVCDFLAAHEYGKRQMDAPEEIGWLCLRYRRLLEVARRAGLRLRVLVTELGLDRGEGWLAYGISTDEYARQLRWWAEQTQADPEVEAGILFHVTSYSFGSWRAGAAVADAVAAINRSLPARVQPKTPPAEPKEEPVKVLLPQPALLWPLASQAGQITQEFGEDAINYIKYGLIRHNGRDIGAAMGTPIVAAHAGQAWPYYDGGYGNAVELWYPNRPGGPETPLYKTIYGHMTRWCVEDGAWVEPGQVIGYVGSTGNSTGPHLHFGFKPYRGCTNPGYRDWVDPRFWMER